MHSFEAFLNDDNEYQCPHCQGDASVTPYASVGLGITCNDSDCTGWHPGGVVQELTEVNTTGNITFHPPDLWCIGQPSFVTYQCPECDSTEIERIGHGDGQGMIDVEVVCQDCDAKCWE